MAGKKSTVKLAGDELGRNACARIEGRKLIVEMDLDAEGKLSASEKNTVIATTGGNQPINDSAKGRIGKLGINLYFPNES